MSLKQTKRDSEYTGNKWNKSAAGKTFYLWRKSINMLKIIGTLLERGRLYELYKKNKSKISLQHNMVLLLEINVKTVHNS
jgi:hypothetical protein